MRCERARHALESGATAVILGDSLRSRLMALKIILFHGIGCVICDRRKSPWGFVFLWVSFMRLVPTQSGRLLFEQLCHVANTCSDSSCFLFFGRDEYKDLLDSCHGELESRFIII